MKNFYTGIIGENDLQEGEANVAQFRKAIKATMAIKLLKQIFVSAWIHAGLRN